MIALENMSLEDKLGQMFMIGFDGDKPSKDLIMLIQKYKIGGVLLNPNGEITVKELANLIGALKEENSGNSASLFIAVEQEGGKYNKMPKELRRLPSSAVLANTGNKNLVYEVGEITGKMLNKIGFNMNLAPVLDLYDRKNNFFLGERSFGTNPNIVASYGNINIKGISEQNVVPVAKHFPGHGTVNMGTHNIIIPFSRKSLSNLEETDLMPFKEAIEDGLECMMIGHINLTRFNLFAPCTTSKKVITKIIRNRYKYEGVLITDDITMPCMDIQYGIKDAARRAIVAGNDIILIKDITKAEQIIEHILKLVNKGEITADHIDASVNRILKLKEKYLSDKEKITDKDVEEINTRIAEITNKIEL